MNITYAKVLRDTGLKNTFTGSRLENRQFGYASDTNELVIRDEYGTYHFIKNYDDASLQALLAAQNGDLAAHIQNSNIHITSGERTAWNGKQNALTAGQNITINGNTISAANTTYNDTEIRELISSEASTRASADTDLQNQINNFNVPVATNTTLGKVKGSTANGKVSVDSNGEMSVNGLTSPPTSADLSSQQSNFGQTKRDGTSNNFSRADHYHALPSLPNIPEAANNGVLTIQKDGTNVATFGANSNSNVTANITIPTSLPPSGNAGGDLAGSYPNPSLATVARTNNTSSESPQAGAGFTAIDNITTDTKGRVTAVNTKTVTLPNSGNGGGGSGVEPSVRLDRSLDWNTHTTSGFYLKQASASAGDVPNSPPYYTAGTGDWTLFVLGGTDGGATGSNAPASPGGCIQLARYASNSSIVIFSRSYGVAGSSNSGRWSNWAPMSFWGGLDTGVGSASAAVQLRDPNNTLFYNPGQYSAEWEGTNTPTGGVIRGSLLVLSSGESAEGESSAVTAGKRQQLFFEQGGQSRVWYRAVANGAWQVFGSGGGSIDWANVTNKPNIPNAANNGVLTIQQNGSNIATFSADSNQNVTANITLQGGGGSTSTFEIPHGFSSTAIGTAAKEVTISSITSITSGLLIAVTFTNGNSVTNPTLNLNSSSAVTIQVKGGNLTADMIPANYRALLQYGNRTSGSSTNYWTLLNPFASSSGGGVSGDYLPLSGGTLTGDLIVNTGIKTPVVYAQNSYQLLNTYGQSNNVGMGTDGYNNVSIKGANVGIEANTKISLTAADDSNGGVSINNSSQISGFYTFTFAYNSNTVYLDQYITGGTININEVNTNRIFFIGGTIRPTQGQGQNLFVINSEAVSHSPSTFLRVSQINGQGVNYENGHRASITLAPQGGNIPAGTLINITLLIMGGS